MILWRPFKWVGKPTGERHWQYAVVGNYAIFL